jgi:hypothetical protein
MLVSGYVSSSKLNKIDFRVSFVKLLLIDRFRGLCLSAVGCMLFRLHLMLLCPFPIHTSTFFALSGYAKNTRPPVFPAFSSNGSAAKLALC